MEINRNFNIYAYKSAIHCNTMQDNMADSDPESQNFYQKFKEEEKKSKKKNEKKKKSSFDTFEGSRF